MKLGFVSAILDSCSFEEVIDYAWKNGFQCVELACWPKGTADRRYAGVSHLDVDKLDDDRIAYVKEYCRKRKVEISSLAYYPNMMDENIKHREENIAHLKKLIVASYRLGVNMVTTFIGRMQNQTYSKNMEEVKKVWKPIVEFAESFHVKIGIENCPMLFSEDEWPGGQNLAVSPNSFRKIFSLLDSEYLGLNFDPSHFVWQQMDYIKPIYEFRNKIFHIHFKDIKVYGDKLDEVGILSTPLSYMTPKLPGFGDVNWKKFIKALKEIGYQGYACLEIEDKDYEYSKESVENAISLSKNYITSIIEGMKE